MVLFWSYRGQYYTKKLLVGHLGVCMAFLLLHIASRCSQSCRSVGSRASRTQSPTRLNDSTTNMIASPGQTAIHHAWSSTSRPSATRFPQVGAGGGTPAPRKLSADSTTIPQPICSVASTTTLLM